MSNRKQNDNEEELELPFVDQKVQEARAEELEENDSLPVLSAAKRNDERLLALLLALGEDSNEADDTGWTALHESAWRGYKKIVHALLNSGANTEAKTEQGDSALHVSAMENEVGIIELVVKAGANLEAANDANLTPLILATLNGNSESVRFLLEHGANFKLRDREGGTLLHQAAQQGDPEVIALYLAAGIKIDAPDQRLRTPLHWAASGFCQQGAETLLDAGADSSARDEEGNTVLNALCGAYAHDRLTIAGADDGEHLLPRSLEQDGHEYHLSRDEANEKKFAKFKERLGPKQASEKTWLEGRFSYRARQAARFTLAMLLEREGIEIDARNKDGETALMIADTVGFHDLVDLLLANGADPAGARLDERKDSESYAFTALDTLDALGSAINKNALQYLNGFLAGDVAIEFESPTLTRGRPIPYLPSGPEGVIVFLRQLLDEAEQDSVKLWAEYAGLQAGRGRNIKKEVCLLLVESEPSTEASQLKGRAVLRVEVRGSQITRVIYSRAVERREMIIRTGLYPA